MPKKKKSKERKRLPWSKSRQRPRLAQGAHYVVVECYDPACGCAPGELTLASLPTTDA